MIGSLSCERRCWRIQRKEEFHRNVASVANCRACSEKDKPDEQVAGHFFRPRQLHRHDVARDDLEAEADKDARHEHTGSILLESLSEPKGNPAPGTHDTRFSFSR